MNLGYCSKCKSLLTSYSQFEIKNGKKYCKSCLPTIENTKENNKTYDNLIGYIKRLFGFKEVPLSWVVYIDKQFKSGKTYSGMQGTLYYFYEIKENEKFSNEGAIGIIETVYPEAAKFFEELEVIKDYNRKVALKQETQTVILRKEERQKSMINIDEL